MNTTAEAKVPVCISIAPQHLQALDDIAERMERSRSWVAARAFESFLAPLSATNESASGSHAPEVDTGRAFPHPSGKLPAAGSGRVLSATNAGGGIFSKETDAQMANYTVTPEAAPHVRATLERNTDMLRRAGEHARQVAAEQQKQREATQRRTAEYLSNIGDK